MLKYNIHASEIGKILIAQSNKGVCSVLLGDDETQLHNELELRYPNTQILKDDGIENMLDKNFDGKLDIVGTQFQKKVWAEISKIRRGKTASYSEIASKLGMPKAYRAVANACAANKLAIIIPCHRVVRDNGAISGYAWGVERKQKLLEIESLVVD